MGVWHTSYKTTAEIVHNMKLEYLQMTISKCHPMERNLYNKLANIEINMRDIIYIIAQLSSNFNFNSIAIQFQLELRWPYNVGVSLFLSFLVVTFFKLLKLGQI